MTIICLQVGQRTVAVVEYGGSAHGQVVPLAGSGPEQSVAQRVVDIGGFEEVGGSWLEEGGGDEMGGGVGWDEV